MDRKIFDIIAMVLVIIGGLNWLVVGIAGKDLLTMLVGEGSVISQVVYILVGLAAVYSITILMEMTKK